VKFSFAFYFFEGYKSNLQVLIASMAEKRLVRNAGALRTFRPSVLFALGETAKFISSERARTSYVPVQKQGSAEPVALPRDSCSLRTMPRRMQRPTSRLRRRVQQEEPMRFSI
jgi:hypothetical protein